MKRLLINRAAVIVLGIVWGVHISSAAVKSGNEYALSLAEAKTPADQKALVTEGHRKQFFFRYLTVLDIQKGTNSVYPTLSLKTREPSSGFTVSFLVQKSLSLAVLLKEPATKVGDAVAVSGAVQSADPVKRTITLNPVIVRYKDLTAPKVGKEMLSERDDSAIIYSFTGGKQAVNVSKRDADLVANEKEMIQKLGKDGWAQYLITEIAKRDKAAKAQRDQLDIYKKRQRNDPEVP
jgi:hypothetical protein